MIKIFDNIYLESSSVYDLLTAIFKVQCQGRIEENSKYEKYIPEHVTKWVESVRKNISEDIKGELKVFFNDDSFLGMGLIPIIWKSKKHKDIEEFLTFFKESITPEEIVKGFFKNGYKKDDIDEEYIQNINSLEGAMELVNTLNMSEEDKWNLLYFYKNPKEAKERLIRLIEYMYRTFLIDEIKKIEKSQKKNLEMMEKELSEDGYNKIDKILGFDYKFMNHIQEVVFIPSYFHGIGLTSSQMGKDTFLVIHGVNRLDVFLKKQEDSDVIDSLKVISDEKRIKIIQLLNEGSYYGYEIGQKLKLSNSTISHHLGLLASNKVIKPIRSENKVYYEVDKDRIIEILKNVEEVLT